MEESSKEIVDLTKKLHEIVLERWLKSEVFTWQWFTIVIIFLSFWYVGIRFIDRKRIFRLSGYAFFVTIVTMILDVAGTCTSLWYYPIKALPYIPRLLPTDIAVVPVTYMLAYQKFPKWKSFLIAMTVISLIFTFVAEPLMALMGLYILLKWKYIYSFPIYIFIGVLSKSFFDFMERKQSKLL